MKKQPRGATKGQGAVMASRSTPLDRLDFFPTPPWATRALCECVIDDFMPSPAERRFNAISAWEPAAGEGHMVEVLREYFGLVIGSDVKDYGKGFAVGSFVGIGEDVMPPALFADWIITNPPFKLAIDFALRAIAEATQGVALLVRTSWIEGVDRYQRLFSVHPPCRVAGFVERVPMVEGRWDPQASSATSYSWIVWRKGYTGPTEFVWIPPGRRRALTKADDVRRFTSPQGATRWIRKRHPYRTTSKRRGVFSGRSFGTTTSTLRRPKSSSRATSSSLGTASFSSSSATT